MIPSAGLFSISSASPVQGSITSASIWPAETGSYVPDTVLTKDEVDAGNVGEDTLRRDDPLALGKVAGRRVNKVRGNNFVRHDLLIVVNILQEQVQCFHPLFQAALQISELSFRYLALVFRSGFPAGGVL